MTGICYRTQSQHSSHGSYTAMQILVAFYPRPVPESKAGIGTQVAARGLSEHPSMTYLWAACVVLGVYNGGSAYT